MLVSIGYTLPDNTVDDGPGHTLCDLFIPDKAGSDLAAAIGSLPNLTKDQKDALDAAFRKLDANFAEMERWASYFFRNCVCHCREDGGT